jgi:hypothetical protein
MGGDREDRTIPDTPSATVAHRRAVQIPPRYRLGEIIGEGGMGRVYRAHDSTLGRDVAVKVLEMELRGKDRVLQCERFVREARTAARLVHPNIVAVHDVDPDAGWLVMALVEGMSLRDLPPPLSTELVRAIARQMLSALAAAHAAGVVHRDVKPSNIIVDLATQHATLIDVEPGADERRRDAEVAVAPREARRRGLGGLPRAEAPGLVRAGLGADQVDDGELEQREGTVGAHTVGDEPGEHPDDARHAVRHAQVPVAVGRHLALMLDEQLGPREPGEAAVPLDGIGLEPAEHRLDERGAAGSTLEGVHAEPNDAADQVVVTGPPVEDAREGLVDRGAPGLGRLGIREVGDRPADARHAAEQRWAMHAADALDAASQRGSRDTVVVEDGVVRREVRAHQRVVGRLVGLVVVTVVPAQGLGDVRQDRADARRRSRVGDDGPPAH